MAPSARSVSTGLVALAAGAGIAAVAAFAGVGPFAAPANAGVATAVPATVAPSAVAAQTFVARPIPVGSGTISFGQLPPPYTYGASGSSAQITEYLCQNATLPPESTPGVPPPSGLGPGEPAIGVRGVLGGHTFFAFFTATRSLVGFENVSRTPAMYGGPLGTFDRDKHVSGTTTIQTRPPNSNYGPSSVTADLTCTTSPTAAPAAVSVAPAAPVATSAPVSPPGNSPWPVVLSVLAVSSLAGGLLMRARGAPDLHRRQEEIDRMGREDLEARIRYLNEELEPDGCASLIGLFASRSDHDLSDELFRARSRLELLGPGFQPTPPPPPGAADADAAQDRAPIE